MKLVFVTQHVDPAHPALAATVPKLRALAARVDELVVLADSAVPGTLPPNCRVRTFGAPTRPARGLRFEAALARELPRRGRDSTAIVAHMCPIYAVLAAPLARPLGVPILLWFAHWRASAILRAAERVATAVVSVDRRSFPLASAKVAGIGHGIDVSEFACEAPAPSPRLRVLVLGRYSAAKGHQAVVHAVRRAVDGGLDLVLRVRGPTLTPAEREHRQALARLVEELGLEPYVELADAVPRARVPALFAASDVLVNNMRAGAPDKVVYEACAACLPVLASNPVFDELLPQSLRFAEDDPEELAARLRDVAALPAAARAELGRTLRERVERDHSVESWAERIVGLTGVA